MPSQRGKGWYAAWVTGTLPWRGEMGYPAPLLLMFLPFLLAHRREWRMVLCLLALVALGFAWWFLATHQLDRFLLPVFPALCLLTAAGLDEALALRARLAAIAVWSAAGFLVVWSLLISLVILVQPMVPRYPTGSLAAALGDEPGRRRYVADLTLWWPAVEYVNRYVPAGERTLLAGEARTFYFRKPVVYGVVFDTNPLETILARARTEDDVRDAFRAERITHLLLQYPEIERLARSYAYTSPATGTRVYGYFFPGPDVWNRMGEAREQGRPWWAGDACGAQGPWLLLARFLGRYAEPVSFGDPRYDRFFQLFRIRSDDQRPAAHR